MKSIRWIDRYQAQLGCLGFMVPFMALVAVQGFLLQVVAPVVVP